MHNLQQLEALPQDLSLSNDGALAFVRTVRVLPNLEPWIQGRAYVWDLAHNPPLLALADIHPSSAEGGDIALAIDDFAVSLSADVNSPTANDLRLWSVAGGGASQLGSNGVWQSDPWDGRIGYGGVAMGPVAVIRHRFDGVSLWDVTTGAPLAPQSTWSPLPDLECFSAWVPGGDAWGLADAVEFTSTRIVSIANPSQPGQPYSVQHWRWAGVGIAEFIGQPTWPRSFFTHPTPACGATVEGTSYWVHDLALSPDGSKCAVSGTDYIGVFNINRGIEIGSRRGTQYPTPNFYNRKDIATLDSVEMTNTHAVVVGNAYNWSAAVPNGQGFSYYLLPNYNPAPPNDNEHFELCVLSLRGDSIHGERLWTALNLLPPDLIQTPRRARACDLAITPNQSKAIVSTRRATIVIDLTQDMAAMTPLVLRTTADPMDFAQGDALLSDVVACTDARAVVIGRRPKANAPVGTLEGVIEVIDLMPAQQVPPAPPTLANVLSTVVIGDNYIPTDVVITPDGSRAVVRSNDPAYNNDPGHVEASRVTIVELFAGTVEFQSGASDGPLGVSRGKDHLECTNEWVVSAGETSGSRCSVQFIRMP